MITGGDRITCLYHHPTASGVLASAGGRTVRIWDVEAGESKVRIGEMGREISTY